MGHCLVVASCTEVVLVEVVGGRQLLASELVLLGGKVCAEVGDNPAVWIVCDGLLNRPGRAVDDSAVVAEVVPGVVVEGDYACG